MERQQQRQRTAEHRETLKGTYEMMLTARREDVKQERRIKEENAEIARQSREFEMQRNREANRAIRQHQKAVHSRFEKQRQAHKEFLAQDFINMISQEDKRREEIEHEIAGMEIDERSHIDRLRALQEEQKSAYDAPRRRSPAERAGVCGGRRGLVRTSNRYITPSRRTRRRRRARRPTTARRWSPPRARAPRRAAARPRRARRRGAPPARRA